MNKLVNRKGRRYGKLKVLKRASNSSTGNTRWLCKCDCGNERVIESCNLKNGTKSCGCLSIEKRTIHGGCKRGQVTAEYTAWAHIKDRCSTNPKHQDYKNYGSRGIIVCERWLNSYENFLEDMGRKPTPEHTIERINNDKGYNPDNCKWATRIEQLNNRRNTTAITYEGQTKTITQWEKHFGVKKSLFYNRLKLYGWSPHKTFTTPAADHHNPMYKE